MIDAAPEVLGVLRGARVRRVDVPASDLIAITISIDRVTTTLVLSLSDAEPGLGLVDERPRGEPAGSFAQLLRKHLNGSTLDRVTAAGQGEARFEFRRDDETSTLLVSVRRRAGGVVLLDAEGRRLAGAPRGIASIESVPRGGADPTEWPRDLDELRVAGHALLERRAGRGDQDHHAELRKTLVRARARLARRVAAIEGDRAKADVTPRLRAEGALLLSSLSAITPRATGDWSGATHHARSRALGRAERRALLREGPQARSRRGDRAASVE